MRELVPESIESGILEFGFNIGIFKGFYFSISLILLGIGRKTGLAF